MSKMFDLLTRDRTATSQTSAERDPARGVEEQDRFGGEAPFVEIGAPEETPLVETWEPGRRSVSPSVPLFSVSFRARLRAPAPSALHEPRLAPELIAFHEVEHPISREYTVLLEEIVRPVAGQGPAILAFAGPLPQAGTTTVVLNLALTLARSGQDRVAVIEAQRRRPAIAERLGVSPTPGLTELLAGTVPISRAMQAVSGVALHAMPIGSGDSLDGIAEFLPTLKHRFDWVLVDASLDEVGCDSPFRANLIDAAYLVVREEQIGDPRLGELQSHLNRLGAPLCGFVQTAK